MNSNSTLVNGSSKIRSVVQSCCFVEGDADLSEIFKIVDLVNSSEADTCTAFAHEITHILEKEKKKPQYQINALLLLDTLVKNCGKQFIAAISTKSFVAYLKKAAGKHISHPKREFKVYFHTEEKRLKDQMQLKILSIIQSYGPLHPNELQIYEETYKDLKSKGIKFPVPTTEDVAPVTTVVTPLEKQESKFIEIKTTINLVESMLENETLGEEKEVLDDLITQLKDKRKSASQYIESNQDKIGTDRDLMSLFSTIERCDNALEKYKEYRKTGKLPKVVPPDQSPKVESIKPSEAEIIDFNEKNNNNKKIEEKKPVVTQDPLLLGLDLIGQPKNPIPPKKEDDKFMNWLLDGIPKQAPIQSNPFDPPKLDPFQPQFPFEDKMTSSPFDQKYAVNPFL